MKKLILPVVGVIILCTLIIGWYSRDDGNRDDGNIGAGYVGVPTTLMGSATVLAAVPNTYSFTDSTTTTETLDLGGQLVTQLLQTEGADKVRFNIMAKGGTATTTMSIRPQVSQDGTNYFDLFYATSTATSLNGLNHATTTALIGPYIFAFDPGVSTTSFSTIFEVSGAKFTRFLFLTEDLAADTTDGAKAWIQAIMLDPI